MEALLTIVLLCLALLLAGGLVALVVTHIRQREWRWVGLWALMPLCGLSIIATAERGAIVLPFACGGIILATVGVMVEVRATRADSRD